MQVFGMQYPATFHQPQRPVQWQTTQPVFGNIGARTQAFYSPSYSTPVASTAAYNNQMAYPVQPRETQFEGPSSNHMLLPIHNLPQGATYSSNPGYMAGQEYYNSQQFHGPGQESMQHRLRTQCVPTQDTEGHVAPGIAAPMGQGNCGVQRELLAGRDMSGGRGASHMENDTEPGRAARLPIHAIVSTPSRSSGGALRQQHEPAAEQMPGTEPSNGAILLSANSSKSSPPYTSSQRKQLRVEEKSYLKEVKRSIAEGRVPQVRLQQNISGDIVQYKSQFLNALKLAALAIVPHADIDIKNPSTMQEIMEEVKRQFIIEKPLPEGMVAGFLQRLYKRNRALYHRHWTAHGDHRKPDDCPSAAWLQLVDYWKSAEGSKECERNKANASSKKGAPVRFPTIPPSVKSWLISPCAAKYGASVALIALFSRSTSMTCLHQGTLHES